MAKIKKIYDDKLSPENPVEIYPITSTQAVYNTENVTVDALIAEGYRFGGLVEPTDSPALSDTNQRAFYFATKDGIYPNFGNQTVENGRMSIFLWNGSAWGKQSLAVGSANIAGYKVLASVNDLPRQATNLGYLIEDDTLPEGVENQFLYVWVGEGGDTLEGMYQNCGQLRGASAYEVARDNGYEGTQEEWLNDPVNGIKGVGISKWELSQSTADSGVSTITVTLNTGDVETFDVYNGKGIASVEVVGSESSADSATNTYRVTYSDGNHFDFHTKNGKGIASIAIVGSYSDADGATNTYRVTYSDGNHFDFNVKNGNKGDSGYSGAAGELQVVNSLDSSDATAALSAAQGKVLKDLHDTDKNIVNVNDLNGTPTTPYQDADAARIAISPLSGLRITGQVITYLLADGWHTEQFIGSDVTNWTTASNWLPIAPITVSQNTETGHTDIRVGNETTPLPSVAEVEALKKEISDLSLGKFYGFFKDDLDLPEGDLDGYAYVGASIPFAIYVFKDGEWSDSGTTYAPPVGNGEDIDTNDNNQLQFADRFYNLFNPDGMGYVILRKDKTFAEQIANKPNTIFEVRYDFDLGDTLHQNPITIPNNCTLKFEGGKLCNGKVIGQNTYIDGKNEVIFDNIVLDGTFNNNICYDLWFEHTQNDTQLFINLGKFYGAVCLTNKIFNVDKVNIGFLCERFFSEQSAQVNFHCGNNGEYNNNNGLVFHSDNVLIEGVSFSEDFDSETDNNPLIGSSLVLDANSSINKITIRNCEFTGSYSSSCFASSKTTHIYIINCIWRNCYMADHAVYSSINTHIIEFNNCIAENVECSGLFKTRESPYLQLFRVDSCSFKSIKGYVLVCTMGNVSVPNANIEIENCIYNENNVQGANAYFLNLSGTLLGGLLFKSCYFDNNIVGDNVVIAYQGSESFPIIDKYILDSCIINNYRLYATNRISLNNCTLTTDSEIISSELSLLNSHIVWSKTVTSLFYNISQMIMIGNLIDGQATTFVTLPKNNNNENHLIMLSGNTFVKTLGLSYFAISDTGQEDIFKFIFIDDGNIIKTAHGRNLIQIADGGSRKIEDIIVNYGGALTNNDVGKNYFSIIPRWWDGSKWIGSNGYSASLSKGTTTQRPTSTRNATTPGPLIPDTDNGYTFFDKDLGKWLFAKIVYNDYPSGTIVWAEYDGARAGVVRYGSSSNRPSLSHVYNGFHYFDTTLEMDIIAHNNSWVDSNGRTPGKHSGELADMPNFISGTAGANDDGYQFTFTDDATYGNKTVWWNTNAGGWVDANGTVVITNP